MAYYLPDQVVSASAGDYIIKNNDRRFHVFKVEGLYLLSKLLPIESPIFKGDTLGFVDERTLAASKLPSMCYLVNSFEKDYQTQQGAITAIVNQELGGTSLSQCVEVNYFPKDQSMIYSNRK